MGLTDPEDFIPGLIITITGLGLIGGLSIYFTQLSSIPFINMIAPLIHNGFVIIANFLTQYINIEVNLLAIIIELLTIIISIIIIVKIGY